MTKTGSMTGNRNHDDASTTKRIKTYDNGGVAPWSDLNHDVLLLVMMQLGVVDFFAFSGVCKFWRSLALNNKNRYMASRTPISMHVYSNSGDKECRVEDFEGRNFKTILPHSSGRECVNLTCGYLILFGKKTYDFWLVNPLTRHGIHFPDVTPNLYKGEGCIYTTLVFSPSISKWVFVWSHRFSFMLWFSVAGKGAWTRVSSRYPIHGIHAFGGKIYTLHSNEHSDKMTYLSELKLYPRPQLMILETKNTLKLKFSVPELVSSGEKLYLVDRRYGNSWCDGHSYKIHELDFGEMKWVSHEIKERRILFISLQVSLRVGLWMYSPSVTLR